MKERKFFRIAAIAIVLLALFISCNSEVSQKVLGTGYVTVYLDSGSRSFGVSGSGVDLSQYTSVEYPVPGKVVTKDFLEKSNLAPESVVGLVFRDIEEIEGNKNTGESFAKCSKLLCVRMDSALKVIGDYAFGQEGGVSIPLEELSMNGVEVIGKGAFNSCDKLEVVTFPSTLEEIKERAFYGCTNLKTVNFTGNNSPIIAIEESKESFNPGNDDLLICVPEEKLEEFKQLVGEDFMKHLDYKIKVSFCFNFKGDETILDEYLEIQNNDSINESRLPVPTTFDLNHDGYTFVEWFTEEGNPVDYDEKFNESLTLYATWVANDYKVVFTDRFGKTTEQSFVYDVEENLDANTFKRTGYGFGGWVTDTAATEVEYLDKEAVINLTTEPNGVVNFYAAWIPNNYKVVFDKNGATSPTSAAATQNFVYGKEQRLTANSILKYARTGYVYSGWNTSADGNGTKYEDGKAVSNLIADDNGVFTLYAQWTPITYTIKVHSNNGKSQSKNFTAIYDNNKVELTDAEFAKTGYHIIGWSADKNSTDPEFKIADKATKYSFEATANFKDTQDAVYEIYTIWAPNTYTVKYDGNGGTVPEGAKAPADQTLTYDTPAALSANTFAKTGYHFIGWATAADKTKVVYAVADVESEKKYNTSATDQISEKDDVTLYAVWEANTYKVKYDGNGATDGRLEDQKFTYDVPDTLRKNAFTKTGYHFMGWATVADKTKVVYTDAKKLNTSATDQISEKEDVTLYAVWEANTYKVVFHDGDSSVEQTGFVYDALTSLEETKFAKTGYHFVGWNTQADFKGTTYADKAEVKNLTAVKDGTVDLYATWEANTYKITYLGNGLNDKDSKEVSEEKTVTYGTDTLINGFARTGYKFVEWNTQADGTGTPYKEGEAVFVADHGAEIKLFAIWEPNTYKIIYRDKGNSAYKGSEIAKEYTEFKYDKGLKLPTKLDVTRTGYIFDGWYTDPLCDTDLDWTDPNSVSSRITAIEGDSQASDITVYALWTPIKYNITLDGNGGILDKDVLEEYYKAGNLNHEGSYTLKPTDYDILVELPGSEVVGTAPNGHHFVGWGSGTVKKDWNGKEKVKNLTDINGAEVTLYAIWAPDEYRVTYHYGENAYAFDENGKAYIINGTTATKLNDTSDTTEYTIAEDGSLTYVDGEGKTQTYASLKIATYGEPYTLTSYSSWKSGSAPNLVPIFAKTGYHFVGWSTTAAGTEVTYTDTCEINATGDVDLYPVWAPISYTVEFYADKEAKLPLISKVVTYEDVIEIPSISTILTLFTAPEGHRLASWEFDEVVDKDGKTINPEFEITAPYAPEAEIAPIASVQGAKVRFNANWVPITYSLRFHQNHGLTDDITYTQKKNAIKELKDKDLTYGVSLRFASLADMGFTVPTGRHFVGWSYLPVGDAMFEDNCYVTTSQCITQDGVRDLYAIWAPNTYTIVYHDGNISSHQQKAVYGIETIISPIADIHSITPHTGYHFVGWSTEKDSTEVEYYGLEFVNSLAGKEKDKDVLNLYAVWEPNTYTVFFNSNDGLFDDVDFMTVTYGEGVGSSAFGNHGFKRDGYTFAGWKTANGDKIEEIKAGDGNALCTGELGDLAITLYAQWNAKGYTINFQSGDIQSETSANVKYDEFCELKIPNDYNLSAPNDGMKFVGWSLNKNGKGRIYKAGDLVKNLSTGDNVTLYAQWEYITYYIDFYGYNESSIPFMVKAVKYNELYTLPSLSQLSTLLVAPVGYKLGGWTYNSSDHACGSTVSGLTKKDGGRVSIYADWDPIKYTVVLHANNGSGSTTPIGAVYHEDINLNTIANYDGFTNPTGTHFIGWSILPTEGFIANYEAVSYTDGEKITNDLSVIDGSTVHLYAVWKYNTYTIKYVAPANDENNHYWNEDLMEDQVVSYNAPVVLRLNKIYNTNNTTHFAGWKVRSITVNGNPVSTPNKVGEQYSNLETVKNLTSEDNAVVTLEGVWAPDEYIITLHGNGGKDSKDETEFTLDKAIYGIPKQIPLNDFKREGYIFLGWSTSEGGYVKYINGAFAIIPCEKIADDEYGHLDLYAVWEPIKFFLNFYADGDALLPLMVSEVEYNETLSYTLPKTSTFIEQLAKPGYHIKNDNYWHFDGVQGLSVQSIPRNYKSTAGAVVNMYAIWEPNTYTIVLNANNGSGNKNRIENIEYNGFNEDGYITQLPTIADTGFETPEGKHFIGWSYLPTDSLTATQAIVNFDDACKIRENQTTIAGAEINLYAVWEPNTYTIVYHDGQVSSQSQDATYGFDSIISPIADIHNIADHTGYHFVGWDTDKKAETVKYKGLELVKNLTAEDNAVVNLYAVWEPNSYTVFFNSNDGLIDNITKIETKYVTDQEVSFDPISRTGYQFNGWNTKKDGTGTTYSSIAAGSHLCTGEIGDLAITLYAQWKPNKYKVELYTNKDANPSATIHKEYDDITFLGDYSEYGNKDFVVDGMRFLGWSKTETTPVVYTDPEDNTSTTTYYTGNVDILNKGMLYNLSEGDANGDTIVKLYAVYEPKVYAITYKDGSLEDVLNEKDLAIAHTYGKTTLLPAAKKTGYNFVCWRNAENDNIVLLIPSRTDKDIVLYPEFTPVLYSINYYNPNNILMKTVIAAYGKDYEIPNVTDSLYSIYVPSGYQFYQWKWNNETLSESKDLRSTEGTEKVYMVVKPNKYEITFNPNASDVTGSYVNLTVTYGETYNLGNKTTDYCRDGSAYSRPGYHFVGWSTDKSAKKGSTIVKYDYANNITLYAIWEANTYNVAYYYYDGENVVPYKITDEKYTKFEYDAQSKLLAPFTLDNVEDKVGLEGKRFVGWQTANLATTYEIDEKVKNLTDIKDATVSLFAKLENCEYKVTYNGNGATKGAMDSVTVPYNKKVNLSDLAFEKVGYHFLYWTDAAGKKYYDGAEIFNISTGEDVVLTANWAVNEYKVVFYDNAGKKLITKTATYEKPSVKVSDLEFGADLFDVYHTTEGWRVGDTDKVVGADGKDVNVVNEILTDELKASTTINLKLNVVGNKYTIKFHKNGADSGELEKTEIVTNRDVDVVLPGDGTLVKAHYSFGGWALKSDGDVKYLEGETVKDLCTGWELNKEIDLYAVWIPETYTVTYRSALGVTEGEFSATKTYNKDMKLSENYFTRDGYKQVGWREGDASENPSDAKTTYSGNKATVLYPVWKIDTYTITYRYSKYILIGEFTAKKTYNVDLEFAELNKYFSKTGYHQIGWATSDDATEPLTEYTANKETVLYPVWAINVYTVTYHKDSSAGAGDVPQVQRREYGGPAITLTDKYFTRTDGYHQIGWAESEGATKAISNSFNKNADTDLYPVWAINKYTVTYNVGNGTGKAFTDTKTHGIAINIAGEDKFFTRTGFKQVGWTFDAESENPADAITETQYKVEADANLFPVWERCTNTVKYLMGSAQGGSAPADEKKEYDGTYSVSTSYPLTMAGYKQVGWNTEEVIKEEVKSSDKTTSYSANEDLNLYPVWTPIRYAIDFFNSVGERIKALGIGVSISEIAYNSSLTTWMKTEIGTAAEIAKKAGYHFVGWETRNEDGSRNTLYSESDMSKLTTTEGETVKLYYALEPNAYTISIKANGGKEADQTINTKYGETVNVGAYTRDGYVFVGFDTSASDDDVSYGVSNGSVALKNLTEDQNATVTLYARWTPVVTYNPGANGTGTQFTDIKPFAKSLTLAGSDRYFAREGYHQIGWATSDGATSAMSNTYKSNDPATLYPVWEINVYSVNYAKGSADNKNAPAAASKEHFATFTVPTDNYMARVGYIQIGWAIGEETEDSTKKITSYAGNENVTLYPVWEKASNTVTYAKGSAEGGEVPAAEKKEFGGVYSVSTSYPLTKTGYTQVGWNTSEVIKEEVGKSDKMTSYSDNADITLYPVWQENHVNVTFCYTSGTEFEIWKYVYGVTPLKNVKYTGSVTLPYSDNLADTGMYVYGWSTKPNGEGTVYTSGSVAISALTSVDGAEIKLHMVLKNNPYTIKFNANGGEGSMSAVSATYNSDVTIANEFAKTGYTFAGWKLSNKGDTLQSPVKNLTTTKNGEVTLYAQWQANTYSVVFDGNGATSGSMNAQTLTYDKAANLSANGFAKTGYVFGGWSFNGGTYADKAEVKNLASAAGTQLTFTAIWNECTYNVQFNPNGGTGSATTQSGLKYGKNSALNANEFTRTGYTFKGWNTQADGKGTSYADKATVSTLTSTDGATVQLYAQWSENKYTIVFCKEDGSSTVKADEELKYTDSTTLLAKTKIGIDLAEEGYHVTGWRTADGTIYNVGDSVSKLSAENGATVKLYRVQAANTYTIKFDSGYKGSGSMNSITVTYGQSVTLPANTFTRSGKSFKQWRTGYGIGIYSGDKYSSGATFTYNKTGDMTLYAEWK